MALQLPTEALFGVRVQREVGTGRASALATEDENHLALAGGFGQILDSGTTPVTIAAAEDFAYFSLTDLGYAPVKNTTVLPPEINPNPFPGGAFTTGAWAEGTNSMIARLDNRLGWLLLAACGSFSTSVDDPVAGANTHTFSPYHTITAEAQAFLPWLQTVRLLPHTVAAQQIGEITRDAHIRSLTLTAASSAPVTIDLDMLGRIYQEAPETDYNFDVDADSFFAPTFDGYDDFAVTNCCGGLTVGDILFPTINVSATITNNLLQPAQSIVIGSMHPMDFPNLTRSVTITATILVEDYEIYMKHFTGDNTLDFSDGAIDQNVGCPVFVEDFSAEFCAQTMVTGTTPHTITIASAGTDNVAWTVQPLRITPNQPIVLQLTGQVLRNATNSFNIQLVNATANYDVATPVP